MDLYDLTHKKSNWHTFLLGMADDVPLIAPTIAIIVSRVLSLWPVRWVHTNCRGVHIRFNFSIFNSLFGNPLLVFIELQSF